MPKVTSLEIQTRAAGQWHRTNVDVLVNAAGLFYCNIPPVAELYFSDEGAYGRADLSRRNKSADPQLFARSMDDLRASLEHGVKVALTPEVTTQQVIRYNIRSNVSFWETSDGKIVPNGYFADRFGGSTQRDGGWCDEVIGKGMFGEHHATNPARDGYSLTIGATAETKRVERLDKKEHVTFERYYGDEDHFGTKHPAARLNGWKSFDLGKSPREIPYTDEAAEFFYRLLHGMAEISRMVQTATFDQADLIKHIENGTSPMLPAPQQ